MSIDSDVKLTSTTNANNPAWSPDGEKIVYSANQAIWIMNSDGSGQKKLYDGMAWKGNRNSMKMALKFILLQKARKPFLHVM
ncbi:MAG: hypothetical protein R2741_07830 [Methanolobus sp.]